MPFERRHVQPDQGSALRVGRGQGPSPPAERPRGRRTAPELAFLALQGVAPGLLLRAADEAARLGITPDAALLGEDFSEDRFYRLLARHLGLPYLERPMRLVLAPGRSVEAAGAGLFRLAVNDLGLDYVSAPRGAALAGMLRQIRPGRGRGQRLAICSPRRLAALVRWHDRPALLHAATDGLADWDAALSAKTGLTVAQRCCAAGLALLLVLGCTFVPGATGLAVALAFAVVFLCAVLLRLAATACSPGREAAADPPIEDRALPIYTIVVPLYRETGVVHALVEALDRIDYPRAKLDIKIMVEADDRPTIAALAALDLPSRYDVIVAPPGRPQTKPRALNIALQFARGTFLTVFDAEDRPQPDQLRRAVARFERLAPQVACLQARLGLDHGDERWLTRMFALEYAGLFQAVMPGHAVLGLPVPLGGTSNHFRVAALRLAGGWDAWNVTEDIDLGFRLARLGLRVDHLAACTFEEAPLTLRPWMKQRRRWLKGWMMTLMVHSRAPLRLWREAGAFGATSILAGLLGTVLGCLFGPLFMMILARQMLTGALFCPSTGPTIFWSTLSLMLLGLGTASAFWPICLGARRQGIGRQILWLPTYPVYLGLVSIACWLALWEAVTDPFGWNKTEHGLAKQREPLPKRPIERGGPRSARS